MGQDQWHSHFSFDSLRFPSSSIVELRYYPKLVIDVDIFHEEEALPSVGKLVTSGEKDVVLLRPWSGETSRESGVSTVGELVSSTT